MPIYMDSTKTRVQVPVRVGAGAVWMGGGDACVALVGILASPLMVKPSKRSS